MASHVELKSEPSLVPVPVLGSDTPSIDAIFRRYAPYVAAIGRALLGRDDDADDLIQEVFLVAVRRIELLREPEAVRGWLATIAVRLARKRLRRRRLLNYVPWSKTSYDVQAGPASDPERRLFLARVYRALDQLPVDHRIAWSLRYLEGERLDAVAKLCGCSLTTAKRRIVAAHERLKELVSP